MDDAYITYKYSENLVNVGNLVFNIGEKVNALTSPFHALLCSVLFYITGFTVLSNKILALFLLLVSSLLLCLRYKNRPELQVLVLSLSLLSSCVLVWTFGGLETVLLLFLVTTVVTLISYKHFIFDGKLLYLVFVLAGLGFLTRYDSALFFIPIILYLTFRARSRSEILVAWVLGSILPIAWMIFSFTYYGDILPNSFYVKTPGGNVLEIWENAKYIASYLFYTGIIPILFVFLFLPLGINEKLKVSSQHVTAMWWLYLGILLELVYGLSMATKHMMFSFRFFVPYLPVAAILVVDLIDKAVATIEIYRQPGRQVAIIFNVFLVCLLLFQGYQIYYTYNNSVNGVYGKGEYPQLGVRDYIRFIDILEKEARDIKEHWDSINEVDNRYPRIYTYAEGMLPYTYQNAYIYGSLVSEQSRLIPNHRRNNEENDYLLSADYIQILAPRHGPVDTQLPKPVEDYLLISSYELYFDGSKQYFLVFYDPNPTSTP